ncbi:SRPBCC family protein [Rhodococcoides yunnanense]|uniref:SRPBCC family protein n=1 Tax=Rhodococcoides yunnanense TaxID=278209 RepID=UPI0009344EAA|nr:SRPBCC family protein [Rhodococcus yunnanensis]
MSHTTRTALPLLALAGALALTITACSTDAVDTPSNPSSESVAPASPTCRDEGVDDDAQIRYSSEILIDAPIEEIWNLQTDVAEWPTWQQPVTSMKLLDSGPLAEGSRFQWTTPAPATATTPATTLTITSTVAQLQEDSCIRWSGPALGDGLSIDNGVHVWNFSEVDGGVLVRTEETWTGAQVDADVPTSTMFLGAGLEAWLNDLKATAEATNA